MRINISDLSSDWIEREWEGPAAPINEILDRTPHNTIEFDAPVHNEVKISLIGTDVDIYGSFTGLIKFQCDRCCESAVKPLKETFHYVLMPKNSGAENLDDEGDEENPELSFYEGEEIDLSGLFMEQIILSIPIKLLCSDSCKGICAGCGADLNTESCECKGKPA